MMHRVSGRLPQLAVRRRVRAVALCLGLVGVGAWSQVPAAAEVRSCDQWSGRHVSYSSYTLTQSISGSLTRVSGFSAHISFLGRFSGRLEGRLVVLPPVATTGDFILGGRVLAEGATHARSDPAKGYWQEAWIDIRFASPVVLPSQNGLTLAIQLDFPADPSFNYGSHVGWIPCAAAYNGGRAYSSTSLDSISRANADSGRPSAPARISSDPLITAPHKHAADFEFRIYG